jgi:hypothetical protein
LERTELAKEKSGVFTGFYCLNPVNQEKVAIWIGDYVIATYGGGAVMVVPAHDQRDFDFAKAYGLEIIQVVVPQKGEKEMINALPDALKSMIKFDAFVFIYFHPIEKTFKTEKVENLSNKNELYFGVKIGDEWRIGLDDLENYLNKLKEFRMISDSRSIRTDPSTPAVSPRFPTGWRVVRPVSMAGVGRRPAQRVDPARGRRWQRARAWRRGVAPVAETALPAHSRP